MIAFLEKITESILKKDLPYLYKRCYIFPSRRAAIHFSNFLKEKFKNDNFIFPEIITIQNFIQSNTSFNVKDDWYLLSKLHQTQNALTHTNQAFEAFLPWGKLILKDFDECDKYLVDATQLYSILKAHKALEDGAVISDEIRQYIEQFIATTTKKEKEGIFKDSFIKTWSLLGDMYQHFQEELSQKQFAYEGMAYRDVLQKLQNNTLQLPYSKIACCGFNALSRCEEEIFKTLSQQYDTEFWWDADVLFIDNKFHEAGNLLRRYQQIFPTENGNSHWIIDDELTQNKNITISGISSNIGQAMYVAQHALQHQQEKTAIVLCDENLITPLLSTVDTTQANITMGYPIAQSELYSLLKLLLNFYGNARVTENKIAFYHKDISALIEHHYFNNFVTNKEKLHTQLAYFVPFMPQEEIQQYISIDLLSVHNSSSTALSYILSTLRKVESKDAYFAAIKHTLIEQIQNIIHLLLENNINIQRNALSFFVQQYISNCKVSFDTNTKSNTQIMGFLETRLLDFDNLYILSMNDDQLPGTNKTNSFIPYNLRKGFGLPTFEQFDGVNAYHFYRLLKRAKNIQLLYNNQVGDNASEKSRFIRQLTYDMATPKNTVKEQIVVLEKLGNSPTVTSSLLQIKKTDEIIANLRERKFSPSAIKTYIKCPVQFYMKYVAGIDEPSEIEEEIDASVFGLILHKTLELIYLPYLNAEISAKTILSFTDKDFIKEKIKVTCNELELPKEITQGSNKLQLRIIERIVEKILHNDAANKQLTILFAEQKFIWQHLALADGTFASIQGTFDRIDKVGDHGIRIIDYKTGKIELPAFPDMSKDEKIDEFLDTLFLFDKKDYSATFQGIMYALIYYKLYHCTEIYVGYHHAKAMKDGIVYLNNQEAIPTALLLSFEKRLSALLSELIYQAPYFKQSENEEAYKYSAYASFINI
ncbi:MAG TPA: PD-(D/E)XK nuclease family protein [Chitinophagales bacterium]|nr:PD-(D/E)XK nuclease family protein [Chitinophagales bacterium]